jgi:hypothetical protein
MHTYHAHADPPQTITQRLDRLKESLQALGSRLKTSIATVIGSTIADAIRDAVKRLLGVEEEPALEDDGYRYNAPSRWDDRNSSSRWDDRNSPDRYWNDDSGWGDQDDFDTPSQTPAAAHEAPKRWRNALTSSLQTALWWLKHQPARRPVLTTVAVALTAGITGFVAGPTLGAGAGVLASIASLLLTSGAVSSAVQLVTG